MSNTLKMKNISKMKKNEVRPGKLQELAIHYRKLYFHKGFSKTDFL